MRIPRSPNFTSADAVGVFFQAEDGIRDKLVTGVQTCALPISGGSRGNQDHGRTGEIAGQRPFYLEAGFVGGVVRPGQVDLGGGDGRGRQSGGRRWRGDRKSVVEGKSVDLGGRRIIKKKKRVET